MPQCLCDKYLFYDSVLIDIIRNSKWIIEYFFLYALLSVAKVN